MIKLGQRHLRSRGTTLLAVEGLQGLADRNGRPISEEAVIQAVAIIRAGVEGIVSVADVLNAARLLDPGELYKRGLERIAGTEDALRKATKEQVKSMRRDHAEEHIVPTRNAFSFLTGRKR